MITTILKSIWNKLVENFKIVLKILEKICNFCLEYSKPIMIICIVLSTIFILIKLTIEVKFIKINKNYIDRKVDLGTISYDKESAVSQAESEETDEVISTF